MATSPFSGNLANLASSLPLISGQDVVGVFDQDFKQVFPNARPLKLAVDPQNKAMQHPVETGFTITDHVITLAVTIELSLILPRATYKTTYQEIKQLSQNRTLLSVQTKPETFKNMIIIAMPHSEEPEIFDAIIIALKLTEVQFAQARYAMLPKNPSYKDTTNRGGVQTKPAPEKSSSILSNAFGGKL